MFALKIELFFIFFVFALDNTLQNVYNGLHHIRQSIFLHHARRDTPALADKISFRHEGGSMGDREVLVAKVREMLYEANLKYGSWDKTAAEIGISRKSLFRYLQPRKKGTKPILPSLETYEMLCQSVGRHCYP